MTQKMACKLIRKYSIINGVRKDSGVLVYDSVKKQVVKTYIPTAVGFLAATAECNKLNKQTTLEQVA